MRQLRQMYAEDPRLEALVAAFEAKESCVVGAVNGGLAPVLLAALHDRYGRGNGPRLVVCGDPDGLQDDLEDLGVTAAVLPQMDEYEEAEEDESDSRGLSRRIAALQAYARGYWLLATPHAVEQPIPRIKQLSVGQIAVRVGNEIDPHDLADELVDAGYKVMAVCEDPGEMAVRGGILDCFPLAAELPVRIEFFGDEIDTIRRFDPETQESIARLEEAQLSIGSSVICDSLLWKELDDHPIAVLADVPLKGRLKADHKRAELRLARQLGHAAVDGASATVERFKGDLQRDLAELTDAATEGDVLILARNEEAQRDLQGHCEDHGITADVRVGRLSAGFRDLERGLLVVHDFELAQRRPARKKGTKVAGGAPLSSLSDLKFNDYIVHINHGIARFKGMAALEKRGYIEDYLLLEFAAESKLYIPVTAIDLIQKYIGGAGRHPELSKLGGAAWRRKKAKAEKAVEDLTAELLETQAKRLAETGISFAKVDGNQRRFESAFPFEETEDQLVAAREIKTDMEAPRPMDRLLCGDVGFGKTEIAMRAAFRAVNNGYQVAVLAPTTILSEQHASSFTERFDGTGVTVACLNRFRAGAERKAILEDALLGEADILIGTHALLSEQLRFANLGLLVVDEEQRFGVKHKEKLKQLRHGIDVLTLSATPIPRTLHFGLLGIRSISVLAEAPADRLSVQTRVTHWDKALIRNAIERELERGGQIFVVHNRVKDIDTIAAKLQRLVPDMRLEIVHGQMAEARISRVMKDFKHGGIDCLLATSIVESGLDIPNANTLFVNNAHCFGLSELHQLRGRIGRFTRQAYSYFLVPEQHKLSTDATMRMDAIQEYVELGAGFKLAMRDLELRGAGNLLGSEQSGHITAIGYELYCRLLNDSVRRQGSADAPSAEKPLPEGAGATLAFTLDAFIPDDYLDAPTLKFEIHKNLDAAKHLADLRAQHRQIRDRYGLPPRPVQRLFLLRAIRIRCATYGISRIELKDRQAHLHLVDQLPAQLISAQVEDLLHVQPDGQILTLFTRLQLDGETGLDFLCRLLDIETEWVEN